MSSMMLQAPQVPECNGSAPKLSRSFVSSCGEEFSLRELSEGLPSEASMGTTQVSPTTGLTSVGYPAEVIPEVAPQVFSSAM